MAVLLGTGFTLYPRYCQASTACTTVLGSAGALQYPKDYRSYWVLGTEPAQYPHSAMHHVEPEHPVPLGTG